MKTTFLYAFAAFAANAALAVDPTVFIGNSEIPFSVSSDGSHVVDTNFLAREFTAYFAACPDLGRFFRTNALLPGTSARMLPAGHDGGPPPEAASDILYFGPPDERIVVCGRALEWLLDQIEAAAPVTNTWSQAESLLADIRSCAITNDLQTCRESFVLEGAVCTNGTQDAEMVAGIASYWSRLHYSSPNVLGFRTGRISENGPELPALFCRCRNPQSRSGTLSSVILVYYDNRWRLLLQ